MSYYKNLLKNNIERIYNTDTKDLKPAPNGRGFYIGNNMTRADTTTTTAAATIPNKNIGFIDYVFGDSVLSKIGCHTISNLSYTNNVLAIAGDPNIDWFVYIDENTDITPELKSATFQSGVIEPRTLTGACPVTRVLNISSESIVSEISEYLLAGCKNRIERDIFDYVATNSTELSVNSDYDSIVAMVGILVDSGMNRDSMCLVGSGEMIAILRSIPAGDSFVVNGDKFLGIIPVYETANTSSLIIGDWQSLTIADWGEPSVKEDRNTLIASGGIVYRLYADFGYLITNTAQFQVITLTTPTN